MWSRLFSRKAKSAEKRRSHQLRHLHHRRARLEPLEPRALLSASPLKALPPAAAVDDVALLFGPGLTASPACQIEPTSGQAGGSYVSTSPIAAALVTTHTTITGTFKGGFTVTVTADNGATLSLHGYTSYLEFRDANGNVIWNHPGWVLQNGMVTYAPTIWDYAKPRFTYGTYTAHARFEDHTPNDGSVTVWYASSEGSTQFVVAPEVKLKAPQVVVTPTKAYYKTFDQVNVRWNAVDGAVKYKVELHDLSRESTSTYESVPKEWDGESLPVGKYSVKVRAIALDGTEGPWSAAKTFTVVPYAVNMLSRKEIFTRSGNEDVVAKWEEPVIPAGLDHYQIRVKDHATGKTTVYANVPVNRAQRTQTWNIAGASLTNGHDYTYWVAGCGPAARGKVAMVVGPEELHSLAMRLATPVLTLDAASGDRTIGLSWNRPPFADVRQYTIRVTDLTSGKSQTVTYKSKNEAIFTDLTLKKGISGHNYAISVKALGPSKFFDTDSEWSVARNYTIV